MKKLYKKIAFTFISVIYFSASFNAQCSVTISQNPLTLLCSGTNPTLTANAPSINQNQPTNTTCIASFAQPDLAQSFIPSVSSVCGAGINLTSTGSGTGIVTIQLWTNLPTAGGTMLATGTVIASPSTWADVIFPSPASVTIGATYYLVFLGSNTSLCIGGTTTSSYAGGNVFANSGFSPFTAFDYAFHTYSCGLATYLWSNGATTAVITPSLSGAYTVTATVGSCTSTAVQSFTINSTPTITVNSGVICSGNSFTISPSGATTYTIQGGSAVKTPTANTSYTVTGTSAVGCTSSTFATSSISVNPTPSITVNSGSICSGFSFTIIPIGAATYTYSGGSAIVTPTTNTSYSVTGTSMFGCISSNTAISSVSVSPSTPVTAATNNSLICIGENAILTASTSATSYTWNTGATTMSISVSPTVTTTYTVNVSNAAACVSSSSVIVTVNACTGINEAFINNKSVFPNPNNGEFTIVLINNGLSKIIQVTNLDGKIVSESTSTKDKVNVNINHLTNGVYFVKILSNNSIEIVKVIKQ